MLEILAQEKADIFPGPQQRSKAVAAFQGEVHRGNFVTVESRRLAKSSRSKALAKWKMIKEQNPSLSREDIKKMQRHQAVERKRAARQAYRENGVSSKGQLTLGNKWRVLEMGNHKEDIWKKKLSFVPVAQVRAFSKGNLAKLQELQERLVAAMRLRGGDVATKTKKHQKGVSLGLTVISGGKRPNNPQELSNSYSGTIQLKKHSPTELRMLQNEVTATITACIEEAFGGVNWYKAVKEAYKKVPHNRRLPDSSLPASNIWWNWNVNKSTSHIDANAMPPCFVLTPYTYNGAELLCSASNLKIPLIAGQVIGGAWQRFPHCNDQLFGDERYSFVAYFDHRMLCESYWIR